MKIKTKYNPEQEVWIMYNNKPIKLFIYSIHIVATLNNDKKITWGAIYYLSNGSQHGRFKEKDIFATKEDLKNNIFK